eukprot:GHVN01056840.1.p1 GENE.GHVN01056840.1~~GHVN01056840.1.p1  ORF type:complete len:571 (+),score=83.99 GHVN01056840.1:200-1912(+)
MLRPTRLRREWRKLKPPLSQSALFERDKSAHFSTLPVHRYAQVPKERITGVVFNDNPVAPLTRMSTLDEVIETRQPVPQGVTVPLPFADPYISDVIFEYVGFPWDPKWDIPPPDTSFTIDALKSRGSHYRYVLGGHRDDLTNPDPQKKHDMFVFLPHISPLSSREEFRKLAYQLTVDTAKQNAGTDRGPAYTVITDLPGFHGDGWVNRNISKSVLLADIVMSREEGSETMSSSKEKGATSEVNKVKTREVDTNASEIAKVNSNDVTPFTGEPYGSAAVIYTDFIKQFMGFVLGDLPPQIDRVTIVVAGSTSVYAVDALSDLVKYGVDGKKLDDQQLGKLKGLVLCSPQLRCAPVMKRWWQPDPTYSVVKAICEARRRELLGARMILPWNKASYSRKILRQMYLAPHMDEKTISDKDDQVEFIPNNVYAASVCGYLNPPGSELHKNFRGLCLGDDPHLLSALPDFRTMLLIGGQTPLLLYDSGGGKVYVDAIFSEAGEFVDSPKTKGFAKHYEKRFVDNRGKAQSRWRVTKGERSVEAMLVKGSFLHYEEFYEQCSQHILGFCKDAGAPTS